MIKKQREKTKHENFKEDFKREYEMTLRILDDFLEVINKVWDAHDNNVGTSKYEKEYLDVSRKVTQYLSSHGEIFKKYKFENLIESYIGLINKSRPYKVNRKYFQTFTELNKRTNENKKCN